jgi:osmotically-inducible protein OsmY
MRNLVAFASLILCMLAAGCFRAADGGPGSSMDSYLDDKVTADRVENSLHHASKMFSDLHAACTNGIVSITGAVTSLKVRQTAADLARQVDGVKAVRNEISIR